MYKRQFLRGASFYFALAPGKTRLLELELNRICRQECYLNLSVLLLSLIHIFVSQIMTGLMISAGAVPVHELIAKLRELRSDTNMAA